MVRNYRSRNRFEKWSKLTNDQIFVLFQFYFMPMYDGVALRDMRRNFMHDFHWRGSFAIAKG